MTPLMHQELSSLVFKPPPRFNAARAAAAAEQRALRKAKYAPGPKFLRISNISFEDLPDADKGAGGGTSDPYVIFTFSTDRGDKSTARTKTMWNAKRDCTLPDVIDMPIPIQLLQGKCNGTLVVRVWDDDSEQDGGEAVSIDDLMGQTAYKFNCRLCPYKLEGKVDRATLDGVGALYAFRISFRYDALPVPEKKKFVPKSLADFHAHQRTYASQLGLP